MVTDSILVSLAGAASATAFTDNGFETTGSMAQDRRQRVIALRESDGALMRTLVAAWTSTTRHGGRGIDHVLRNRQHDARMYVAMSTPRQISGVRDARTFASMSTTQREPAAERLLSSCLRAVPWKWGPTSGWAPSGTAAFTSRCLSVRTSTIAPTHPPEGLRDRSGPDPDHQTYSFE